MATYMNVMKQIEGKKAKMKVFAKHNMPKKRKYGLGNSVCRRCGNTGMGIIRKYGLNYCRQCFREIAKELGFRKYG